MICIYLWSQTAVKSQFLHRTLHVLYNSKKELPYTFFNTVKLKKQQKWNLILIGTLKKSHDQSPVQELAWGFNTEWRFILISTASIVIILSFRSTCTRLCINLWIQSLWNRIHVSMKSSIIINVWNLNSTVLYENNKLSTSMWHLIIIIFHTNR